MSDHSESDVKPWAEHLPHLYADGVASDVARWIAALAGRYRSDVEVLAQPLLSARDVVLITYGDSLQDGETRPLQVLHRFHSEYLNGLFDIVHILPFQPFSSDAGFSVIDYYAVRDDLGDWDDIKTLSQDCRLMVDAVINHMSSESDWFRSFLAGEADYAEYFVEGDPKEDYSAVVRPRTSPLLTPYTDGDGQRRHVWTTFSADQVDLNYGNPDVLLAILDVLFFHLQQGARLLRLDAVTFLWKVAGTSCANLPETHAIIKIIRGVVAEVCPSAIIITETNVPHHENIAYFGDGHDEAHMVYNFALPPLIAHSFIQGDGRRLSTWVSDLSLPSNEVCFLNFSASHDGIGVRPVEEILSDAEVQKLVQAAVAAGGQVSCRTIDGEERPYELNCTFLDLISTPGEAPELTAARFVASQAIVLALPGVPAIYIQSLLGTRNDLVRVKQTGRARSINRSRLKLEDVADALRNAGSLTALIFAALEKLIIVRRQEPAFDPYGSCEVLDLGREVFAVRRRTAGAGQPIVAVVNLTGGNVTIRIDEFSAGVDTLTGQEIVPGPIKLAAYAVRWIRCSEDS